MSDRTSTSTGRAIDLIIREERIVWQKELRAHIVKLLRTHDQTDSTFYTGYHTMGLNIQEWASHGV